MKKTILLASCLFGLCSTATAAKLVMPVVPEGLKNGYFSINCTYNQGNYSSEGPVTNWGTYGLLSSLNDMNVLIADEDSKNFHLTIHLSCKNDAGVSYQFDDKQLKAGGDIVVNPPQNCA